MKKSKRMILMIMALLLVVAVSLTATAAYFTDQEEAVGGLPILLGEQTEIEEELDGLNKHIKIENKGETDVVVRVRIIGDTDRRMKVTPEDGWVKKGDFYYYTKVLTPGQKTSEIFAEVTYPKGEENRAFDIIVVHESSQVYMDGDRIMANDTEFDQSVTYAYGEGA